MGDTISTLVFRPPAPTAAKEHRHFFLKLPLNLSSQTMSCGVRSNSCGTSGEPHKISAFFIKQRGANLTLLFSHGNAEDLGMMFNRMTEMSRVLGVNILAYDYPGYGHSTGEPSEDACYRSIEAAYKYLREVRKVPALSIVLYGRSLGSGPSCYLAAKTASEGESVAGLILHSPFLSVFRIVLNCGFNLAGDMFTNISHAPDVQCPVLVIHGTKDQVVPFWHGDQLLQCFPPEFRANPFWVDGLGHNNIEIYAKKEYVLRVTTFLDRYVPSHSLSDAFNGNPCADERNVPMIVPDNERYSPGPESPERFFVNPTWVKHGVNIVNEAVSSKKVADSARKQRLYYLPNNLSTSTADVDKTPASKTKTSSSFLSQLVGVTNKTNADKFMVVKNETKMNNGKSKTHVVAMTREKNLSFICRNKRDIDIEERDDVPSGSLYIGRSLRQRSSPLAQVSPRKGTVSYLGMPFKLKKNLLRSLHPHKTTVFECTRK